MDKAKTIVKFLLAEDDDLDVVKDVLGEPPEPDAYDIWEKKYRPIKNRLVEEGEERPFDGTMFETYGAEVQYVRVITQKNSHYVWTLVTGDNNESIIVPDWHFVNRNGYFITEVPWTDLNEEYGLGDGDPQNAQETAEKMIDYEMGQDWKKEWVVMTPEIKIEKVNSFMNNYGLEFNTNEVMTIIDRLAADQ